MSQQFLAILHQMMSKIGALGQRGIYNEFSLQFELGYLLRERLRDLSVKFEKNISNYSDLGKNNFIKKEIDLSLENNDGQLCCAIELKYPTNGQVPEQMFSFIKDIKFLEQIRDSQKQKRDVPCFFIALGNEQFYQKSSRSKSKAPYWHFRQDGRDLEDLREISGTHYKPTGMKDYKIYIDGNYKVSWKYLFDNIKYFIVEV